MGNKMEKLISDLESIIKPIFKEKDIIPDHIVAWITQGYEILTDKNREAKDRVQLSCNYFDLAVDADNPYKFREILLEAIGAHEAFFDVFPFVHTRK